MRIKAKFEMNTDWLIKDYRSIFMALIKKVFEEYDQMLLVHLYGTEENPRKVNKQFTFYSHFPKFQRYEKNRLICGNETNLYFSTNDELLATAFYNGLKQNRELVIGKKTPISFSSKDIWLLPLKKINTNKITFKSLSPILVNNKGNNLQYLSPCDKDFNDAFGFIIAEQARQFGIPINADEIEFEITKMKKLPLSHFHQTMTAWLGEFDLVAPKEVLQLVYDIGIGVRRSQGFGMLEIHKN